MGCEEGKGSRPVHTCPTEKFSNEHTEAKGRNVGEGLDNQAQASDAVGIVLKAENANDQKGFIATCRTRRWKMTG